MEKTWQELIHGDAFFCAVCKKIPATSLWLNPDRKNICNNCYESERDKYTGAIENAALNWVMQKMSFPCEHSDRGCGKVLMYENYHEHVSECPYTQTCVIGECAWVGTRQQLMMHLFEAHPDSTISEVDGAFPIPCSEEVLDTKYFIQTKAGRVIVGMKRDSDMLYIVIYSSDNLESSTGQFMLQYGTGPSSTAQHVCTVSNDVDCLTKFYSDYTLVLNINEHLDESSVQLVYKSKKPTIPQQLMKHFSCYDCHNITAIKWECYQSHPVCDHCSSHTGHRCSTGILKQDKLIKIIEDKLHCQQQQTTQGIFCENGYNNTSNFPHCQQQTIQGIYSGNGYNNTSNFPFGTKGKQNTTSHISSSLFGTPLPITQNLTSSCNSQVRYCCVPKDLIDEFEFPCCYEAQGCKFVGPASRNHEATCDFIKVTCPVGGCNNNYYYSELMSHMTQNHHDWCAVQNTKQFVVNLDLQQQIEQTFYLIYFNMLFNYKLKLVKSKENVYSYRWIVEEVSGKSNSNFLYTVDITGGKSLRVTYVCGETLALRQDIVNGFANQGQIKYSIKITEKAL